MSIKRMKITDGILDIRMFLLLCRNKLDYSMYASRLEVANQQQKTSPKAQKNNALTKTFVCHKVRRLHPNMWIGLNVPILLYLQFGHFTLYCPKM